MSLVATTTTGSVRGVAERGVVAFKGVPYAAPPVGERRFRPPVPAEAWRGERDAVDFGSWAPQRVGAAGAMGAELGPIDEDCLTLNIWTPSVDGARRPVMVWIHGGGFLTGSGASVVYRGDTLSSRGDVVVVTVNYRLGVLGYLAHPSLVDESTGVAANWGVLDQAAALHWVAENIASFGGDPDNVTVFGESAGSMSVGALLAMADVRPLVSKAIMQSGPPLAVPAAHGVSIAEEVAAAVGLAPVELAKLRDLPLELLLDAQEAVARGADTKRLALPFAPVVDGVVLSEDPAQVVASGAASGIAQLAGTNRDEMKLWGMSIPGIQDLDDESLVNQLAGFSDRARATEAVRAYRAAREQRGAPTSPFELWSAISSDRVFRVPAMDVAAGHAAAGGRSWAYLFNWESPAFGGILGACHALELPFVFGSLTRRGLRPFAGEGDEALALATEMQDAWLAFVRDGDPGWPAYDAETRTTRSFGGGESLVDAPMEAERSFWD